MFQFPEFCPSFDVTRFCLAGFPHSDINGSMLVYNSPLLFAANHVLLRLLVPWHPPYALNYLTILLLTKRAIFLKFFCSSLLIPFMTDSASSWMFGALFIIFTMSYICCQRSEFFPQRLENQAIQRGLKECRFFSALYDLSLSSQATHREGGVVKTKVFYVRIPSRKNDKKKCFTFGAT